ncbi:MAG: hypothetical protein QNJ38_03325 [Prochloraceae cyanobacterium]|nr:hypothetical protein [Prochloraceae cyanobacterium]
MTISNLRYKLNKKKENRGNLWDRFMAILASANLALVLFDMSYVPLRDFWLQGRIQYSIKFGLIKTTIPEKPLIIPTFGITKYYDQVKAIEGHDDTDRYLELVAAFNREIDFITQQAEGYSAEDLAGTKSSLLSKIDSEIANYINYNLSVTRRERIREILANLRVESKETIDKNPFQIANKTGTLEKIKNRMRVHIFDDESASSTKAFQTFWTLEYLTENGVWKQRFFFQDRIVPLIETNYYRPVGENGQPVDYFGLIDFLFFPLFAFDFSLRILLIHRRYSGVTLFDAVLWRWYDLFLFIPVFRWLRIIPVTIRLNRAKLIDLSEIIKQTRQGFVANIAEDLTEIVVVRLINQVQEGIRQGEITKFLNRENVKEYIDLNNTNETAEIAKIIAKVFVERVIPKLKPDVEAILKYSIEKVIHQSPAYQQLKILPGMEILQSNLVDRLISQTYQTFADTLNGFLAADPEFDRLLGNLVNNFNQTWGEQIQTKESLKKIEILAIDLLEEIKVNYVENLSQEDIEQILEQTRKLHESGRNIPKLKSAKLE